eukprot:CAMPEP_0175426150 /NCGR_PEP_ID=MMETSP0095-20121207/49670_1 /TAXON_ID=311494 /ORGANISM="Alexandrium monilatum, Strain CCMP3105" /LENGTH=62 /DNA_ID=CAMNT_0016725511 /DNA_START=3 /DNA_END=188 /DNA_ORIENTATION=+
MAAPRSMILTAAVALLGLASISRVGRAFVPAAHKPSTHVEAPTTPLPTAALSAAAIVAPTAA